MPFILKAKVQGVDRLVRILDNLKQSVRNRISRTAVRKGATVILQAARRAVSVRTGLLKKSLGVVMRTYKSGRIVAIIGPRSGFKKTVVTLGRAGAIAGSRRGLKLLSMGGKAEKADPVRYAHLVEKHKPFMRPALDSTKAQVSSVVQSSMLQGLARLAARGAA